MSYWTMYLVTRLDTLNGVLQITTAMLVLGVITFCLFALLAENTGADDKTVKGLKRCRKISVIALAVSLLLICVIPTTEEVAAIYLIPKMVNNEQVQKLPDNAVKLLNTKMEEWIKDSLDKETK